MEPAGPHSRCPQRRFCNFSCYLLLRPSSDLSPWKVIFISIYTSCVSGWYFIFIISCVISHSSIKNNFEYTPQLKAGTFFAVPTPSSGAHTTGGIQPDGVYHWYTPCFAFAFFLSARQSRCTDLMTSVFWHAIRSIHLLAFHTDILFPLFFPSCSASKLCQALFPEISHSIQISVRLMSVSTAA